MGIPLNECSALERDVLFGVADTGSGTEDDVVDWCREQGQTIEHPGPIASTLNGLVEAGLVAEIPDEADESGDTYRLTERGTELLFERLEWELDCLE